jgi:hypothetical protein
MYFSGHREGPTLCTRGTRARLTLRFENNQASDQKPGGASRQQPAQIADASSDPINCAVTKNRTRAPRPASVALTARNADPCPILCIKAPCKVIATAVRDASFVLVVCDPCLFGLARPPHASTLIHRRTLRFENLLATFSSAHVIIRRPAHCAGPHPDDEHYAKRGWWPPKKCGRERRLDTAIRAAQAFCHGANAVSPAVWS